MSDYFTKIQEALHAAGVAKPTLVIDKTRLTQNIKVMTDFLPKGMGYRIVAKSLPCAALIQEVRAQTKTDKLMVFNIDYVELLTKIMPECQMLMGKPIPQLLVQNYLSKTQTPPKIEWLIDSLARLEEYGALNKPVAINLELDVGLHRGGFNREQDISTALDKIAASAHLTFAGFMGYEPHLASLPEKGGLRDRAKRGAWDFYQKALAIAQSKGFDIARLTRNAAGSPTYRFYEDTHIANEVSVGSVLIKPMDFDIDILEKHIAASFIATPILKRIKGVHVPGLEWANEPSKFSLPENTDTTFVYGGRWMAKPVYPEGAKVNEFYGKSSNQELIEIPDSTKINVGDFVFYRPTQSEAVLTYLGDIAVYEDGKIVDFWQPFPARP